MKVDKYEEVGRVSPELAVFLKLPDDFKSVEIYDYDDERLISVRKKVGVEEVNPTERDIKKRLKWVLVKYVQKGHFSWRLNRHKSPDPLAHDDENELYKIVMNFDIDKFELWLKANTTYEHN